MSWSPADLHLAPAVCGRFSLVDVGAPDGGWGGAVEGGVTLDSGIDRSFFPLETAGQSWRPVADRDADRWGLEFQLGPHSPGLP